MGKAQGLREQKWMAPGQQRCSCGRAQRIEILIVHWHPFVLSKILLLRQQSALAQSMAGRLQALAPRVLVCYHSQGESGLGEKIREPLERLNVGHVRLGLRASKRETA